MVCGFCVCGTVRPVEMLGLAVSVEVTEEGLTAVSLALFLYFHAGFWVAVDAGGDRRVLGGGIPQ